MVSNLQDWVKNTEQVVENLSNLAKRQSKDMSPEQQQELQDMLKEVDLKDVAPHIAKITADFDKFQKKYS